MPATTKSNKPHTHYHLFLKDGSEVLKEVKTTVRPDPHNAVENLIKEFAFVEYVKNFAFYKNEATEYIRFEGTLVDQGYKLTVDAFSCYCSPLNVGQEPPF